MSYFLLFKASRDLQKVVKLGYFHFSFILGSQDAYSFHAHRLQAAQAPLTSPPIIITTTVFINYKESIVTVEGVPGDLTSHGWMQGAFTGWIHCVHIQLRGVLSGDIIRTRSAL